MREVEFVPRTDEQGMMSFRVDLPLARGRRVRQGRRGRADGLPDEALPRLAALGATTRSCAACGRRASAALEFCWIPGGWDADRDGVMEGCQHNTMDVEYYGPNPQMGLWYLGALRAAEEMAAHVGDQAFAADVPRAVRSRPRLDRRAPLQRRVLRARGAATAECVGRGAEPARGHGRPRSHAGPSSSSVRAAWSISSSASSWRTSAAWATSSTRTTPGRRCEAS